MIMNKMKENEMIIKSVIDAEVVKSKNGVKAQKIHDDSNSQAIHLTLEPGARLDTHITPVDVFFYILEGVATIEIGDEKENIRITSYNVCYTKLLR